MSPSSAFVTMLLADDCRRTFWRQTARKRVRFAGEQFLFLLLCLKESERPLILIETRSDCAIISEALRNTHTHTQHITIIDNGSANAETQKASFLAPKATTTGRPSDSCSHSSCCRCTPSPAAVRSQTCVTAVTNRSRNDCGTAKLPATLARSVNFFT